MIKKITHTMTNTTEITIQNEIVDLKLTIPNMKHEDASIVAKEIESLILSKVIC